MNPYKVLNIGQDAGRAEVMAAVARAMRERKYSAREIAQAQKTILNPAKRTASLFGDVDFSVAYERIAIPPPPEPPDPDIFDKPAFP